MLLSLIQPRGGYSIGRSPREILDKENINCWTSNKNEAFEKYELENLQNKIDETLKSNNKRAKKYKQVLYTLLISFSLLIAASSFILIF